MRNIIRSLIPALAFAALPALPATANAGIEFGLSVGFAPPELPVYEQPEIPGPGYLWVPGYWGWDGGDYYWVPGTWAMPPVAGFLWTPGYWGGGEGSFLWHVGYWGLHVGFYGGINYGFGYGGDGYEGGYWRGSEFCYNRAVNNVSNISVSNVYNSTVINNVTNNHTSFSGGMGGVMARPSARDLAAEHERHVGPSGVQREQEALARQDNTLRASANGGRPPIAATPRPGAFNARGVVAAHAAGEPRMAQAAPQNRTDRPQPASQVNAPQYRSDRPRQASQVNAPQYRTDRPQQASLPRAPQYSVNRAPQPMQSHVVSAPRPASPPPQSHQQTQVSEAGNTHQNHGH